MCAYYFIRWTFAGVFCTPIMNPRGAFVGKDSTQNAADILDMLSSNTCAKRRSIPFLFDYDRFIPTQFNSL